ncbi:hypothetical protein PZB75_23105 [Streptomyces sp. AM 4-1-1]|uniref:hypothetical protein n=1 Tax=Streptomyces sp. AM 4-1-1 TaxID=3028710 RepID=UPI0023B99278|nr:hypothetical protein [Streptomyces sp. AM 4-1-1]WEH35986.1 hypothetical protein PZB75_23105 [Streptomyces sp. AM 4-1-1]
MSVTIGGFTSVTHVAAPSERATAELRQRRRAVRHVTLRPDRIGGVARAALVLNAIRK